MLHISYDILVMTYVVAKRRSVPPARPSSCSAMSPRRSASSRPSACHTTFFLPTPDERRWPGMGGGGGGGAEGGGAGRRAGGWNPLKGPARAPSKAGFHVTFMQLNSVTSSSLLVTYFRSPPRLHHLFVNVFATRFVSFCHM